MTFHLIANDTTLPILADASPAMLDAILALLEGEGILAIPHTALNRDDRRNLLKIRDNLIRL